MSGSDVPRYVTPAPPGEDGPRGRPAAVAQRLEVLARNVGARVVVRRVRPDEGATDLTGELLALTPQGVDLRTATGVLRVAPDEIAASRVVPPRARRRGQPHRALWAADVERIAADHWRAPERERLGDWLLRAAGGFTARANSVLPLGDPGMPPAEAVRLVARWYEERGLRPTASCCGPWPSTSVAGGTPGRVGTPSPPCPEGQGVGRAREVDESWPAEAAAAFRAAGWEESPGSVTLVLTAATRILRGHRTVLPRGLALDLAESPDAHWLELYGSGRAALGPEARVLLVNSPAQVFASVREGSRTVAVARGSLAHGWLGVYGMAVRQEYRRRGLATHLLAALGTWAGPSGAASALLQVLERNTGALELYRARGFTPSHVYRYLVSPRQGT